MVAVKVGLVRVSDGKLMYFINIMFIFLWTESSDYGNLSSAESTESNDGGKLSSTESTGTDSTDDSNTKIDEASSGNTLERKVTLVLRTPTMVLVGHASIVTFCNKYWSKAGTLYLTEYL